MSGAALAALLLGSGGLSALVTALLSAWAQKRTGDREDDRLDLDALVKANERLVATVESYRVGEARMERLEHTVEKQDERIQSLEEREAECQRQLATANLRIEALMRR